MSLKQQLSELRAQMAKCSQAIEEIEQSIETEPQRRESPDLIPIIQYLSLAPDISEDQVLENLLKCAMHVVGGSGAGLTLFDPVSQKLIFRSAIGDGAEGIVGYQIPMGDSQHGLAFATGEIQSATPLNKDVESKTNVQFRNVLVAPLIADNEPIGTISAVNKRDEEHFSPEDMEAYGLFAAIAALLIRQRTRESDLRSVAKGIKVEDTATPALLLTEQDKEIMLIMRTIVDISRQQPELLQACRHIVELIASTQR